MFCLLKILCNNIYYTLTTRHSFRSLTLTPSPEPEPEPTDPLPISKPSYLHQQS